jgi:hypothetical protein
MLQSFAAETLSSSFVDSAKEFARSGVSRVADVVGGLPNPYSVASSLADSSGGFDITRGFSAAVSGLGGGLSGPVKSFSDILSAVPNIPGLGDTFGGITGFNSESGIFSNLFDKHTLLGMQSRSDPLLSFMWFCIPPKVHGVSLPWYYVEEFTAPFRSFDVVTQYREGKVYHFAGQHSISNLSIRFYDDSTGKTGAYLEAWRKSVLSKDGLYNYPGGPFGYKKNIKVVVLDVTKFGQVYTFNYKGCWPTTSEPFNLISGASDRIIPSQEFACDEVDIQVRRFPPLSLIGILKDGIGSFQGAGLDMFSSSDFPGASAAVSAAQELTQNFDISGLGNAAETKVQEIISGATSVFS